MSGNYNANECFFLAATLSWFAANHLRIITVLSSRRNEQIIWRPSRIRDFRNRYVVATAERLIRWDSGHPDTIFRSGFEPRVGTSLMAEGISGNVFNLRRYAERNEVSIFVGTTRTRRVRGQVERWRPRITSSETHFEYEVFAPGGIDVNQSLGSMYRFRSQFEIAFPGGIRPQFIRSAVEYIEEAPIRIWYNEKFNPQTIELPVSLSSLSFPLDVTTLEVVYWLPDFIPHPDHRIRCRDVDDSPYVDLMREPGEPAVDPLMAIESPSTHSFHTSTIRDWQHVTKETSQIVPFSRTYNQLPGLPIGLTAIDASNNSNIRVKCFGDRISNTGFTVNVNTWNDSTLYGGGCRWMEIPADNPDFQYGTFSTADDHPWFQHQEKTASKITFREPYTECPKVVVWLTLIDMEKSKNWTVKTYVTKITPTDFNIHLDTWGDTILHGAEVCWVAYPGDATHINSGSFNTMDVRSRETPACETGGKTHFKYLLGDQPCIMAALNWIDADCSANLRLYLAIDTLPNHEGFEWKLNTWEERKLHSAGASWIAWN